MRESKAHEIDYEVQLKEWLHPVNSVRITEQQDENAIQIFTDGSQSEYGLGAGISIFIQNKLVHQVRYKLHNRRSNNQAE
jgi:chorismate synthase